MSTGAASAAGGFAGTAPDTGSLAGGSGSATGGSEVPCEPELGPAPITGDLVGPAVVWERVTRLIEGEDAPPPSNLPMTTTYAWVSDIVMQSFARARRQGLAPGTSAFVNYWLFDRTALPEPSFEVDWAASLLEDEPVLNLLMLEPVGEHGYGIFSERAWLSRFPTISERGAGVAARVFGNVLPPPPQNTPSAPPSAELTRRQELVAVVGSDPACKSCHALFDSLGYAYGHFDELGQYESLDDGFPVDTSGNYEAAFVSFSDLEGLGTETAASCEARKGLVLAFARSALGMEGVQLDSSYQMVELHRERLQRAFLFSAARSYQDLVLAYAQSPLVLQR